MILWVVPFPRQVVLGIRKLAKREPDSSVLPWHLLQVCESTSPKDESSLQAEVNPLSPKLLFLSVFYHSNRIKLEQELITDKIKHAAKVWQHGWAY